jgi:hypothetical protein
MSIPSQISISASLSNGVQVTIGDSTLFATHARSASFAATASYVEGVTVLTSASVAQTSSLAYTASVAISSSFAGAAISASYGRNALSSSYAVTSSFATLAKTAQTASAISFVPATSSFSVTSSYVASTRQAATASLAITASYVASTAIATSASYTLTASFAAATLPVVTASYALNSGHANSSDIATSASYSDTARQAASSNTASLAINSNTAVTASYALFAAGYASGSLTQPQADALYVKLTGASSVTGSISISGSLTVTGVANLQASSAVSSSYASSASYALTSSYATSASFAQLARSASYAPTVSSSYATTSSFAVTASYALNASSAGLSALPPSASFTRLSVTGSSDGYFVVSGSSGSTSADIQFNLLSYNGTYYTGQRLSGTNVDSIVATYGSGSVYYFTFGGGGGLFTNSSVWKTDGAFRVISDYYGSGSDSHYSIETLNGNGDTWLKRIDVRGSTDTASVHIQNATLIVSGALTASTFMGNGAGITGVISASYAQQGTSASFSQNAIIANSSTTASLAINSQQAVTASYALFAAGFASGSLTQPQADALYVKLTGTSSVTGSVGISGSLTSSALLVYGVSTMTASRATSASHADISDLAISATTSLTSSVATSASYSTMASTASLSVTSSYALVARSSSFATSALTANIATTASYVASVVSASYALTSSYSLNAAGGGISQGAADARYLQLTGGTVSGSTVISGSLTLGRFNVGNSSTAFTVDWKNGNKQTVTLTNHATMSFQNAGIGQDLDLAVIYSGAFDILFPNGLVWSTTSPTGSYSPRLSSGSVDLLTFSYDGVRYFAGGFIVSGTAATVASASFAQTALTANSATTAATASYVASVVSSSYALSASWAPGSAVTASYALTAATASYVLNSISSSYSVTASYALTNAGTVVSTSFAQNAMTANTATSAATATSASYALTASYALNGSGSGITQGQADARYLQLTGGTVSGSTIISGSLTHGRFNIGNSSTAFTVDWRNGNRQTVTLTNHATMSFASSSVGQDLDLVVIYSGAYDIVFPATVVWSTTAPTGSYSPRLPSGSADLFSFAYDGVRHFTNAFIISGSPATSASYATSASFASNALTANTATSATTATTASYVATSSLALLAVTSSYLNAVPATASFALLALTASYVASTISSSYALTASYALNGGSGGGGITQGQADARYLQLTGGQVSGSTGITGSLTISGSSIVRGPSVASPFSIGNAGAAFTVDWRNGNLQRVTLNQNSTMSFAGATDGQSVTLQMAYAGTFDVLFPNGLVWSTNSPTGSYSPRLPSGSTDIFVFDYDGTKYYAGAFIVSGAADYLPLTGGNVAGTVNVTGSVYVKTGDVEVSGSLNGLVLMAPNGTRWRISVSNAGVLTTTNI